MKKLIIALVVVSIAALGAMFALRNSNSNQKFKTEKVSSGDLRYAVTATGTMNAVTTVLVGTQVSGTIKHLYADFNSHVKKGEMLAQIDTAVFDAQVEQARAGLIAAQANVEKAEAALLDAKRVRARNEALFSRDLIARSDLDTSETNEMAAAAQLKAATAQVGQARAALKVAETNLRYANILSPVDGMVISRNVDVGQTVAASFQTPTLFTIAQDLTKMQINTNVDEADIGKIRVGHPVEFTVDAYPDQIFKGTVSVIRNAPATVQNVVTYDVVVKVRNPDLILKPGMTANVSIITAAKKSVVKVPDAALRFQLSAKAPKLQERKESRGYGVWVLENNNPKRVAVAAGISDGSYTEVVSGDLKAGDEVIVSTAEDRKKQENFLSRKWFH